MSKTTLTVGELIELARFEFRRFGFRADGTFQFVTRDKRDTWVFFWFNPEPATGQSAFSQRVVTPYIQVLSNRFKNHDGITMDTTLDWAEDDLPIILGVQYEHDGGGGNKKPVRYRIQHDSIGEFTLKLDC